MTTLPDMGSGFTVKPGAPRWMVTFADLMSLLFALFVLLLSFADFEPTKFKTNADGIRGAFKEQEEKEILSGQTILPNQFQTLQKIDRVEAWKANTADILEETLHRELKSSMLTIETQERKVVIRFPGNTAFETGGIGLSDQIIPALRRVGSVLTGTKGDIVVSGHTDDIPITGGAFRSNWDLSTARANSVVHFLLENTRIEPNRMTAQGFADSRPLTPNVDETARSKNRRVEISVEVPEAVR